MLQKAGIGLAAEGGATGKSMIVLPVYQSSATSVLWDDPNPWRDAWAQQQSPTSGAARFRVPLGDAGDVAAIDAAKARAGNAAALAKIAQQNGGDEVIVAVAVPRAASGGPTGSPAGLPAGPAGGAHRPRVRAQPESRHRAGPPTPPRAAYLDNSAGPDLVAASGE